LTALSTGNVRCIWSEANRLARSSTLKGRPGYLANITTQEENDFLKDNLNGALNVWMGGSDGTCNGESGYTRLGNSFDYMTDTTIADRCSYSRNDVGGTTGQGNYTSSQSGGTEGAFHWYDGPEAGQTFWRYYESSSWSHSSWTTWASTARERTAYNTGSEDANSATAITKHDRPSSRYVNWCWTSSGCHEPNNSSSSFTFGGVSNSVQGEDNIVFNWNTTDGKWNDLHESEPTVPFYGYIIEYGDGTAFTGVASSTSTLRMNQTITFSGAASSYSTQTVNLTAATTTSGLTISYASSDTAICTVSSSAVVTLVSRGTCAITASQAGNTDYLAATDVTQTFTSNFGTAASGLITSCDGLGELGNGGFETIPTVTENTDSSFGGVGRWHGYNGANNNQPRIYLFLNPSGSNTFALDSWLVTVNTRIEIQRAPATGFGLTAAHQTPDSRGVNPSEGLYFAELNADQVGTLYQDIATLPGTTLRWSLDHRGRRTNDTTDTMRLNIGPAGGTLVAQTPETRPASSGSGTNMTDARGSSATQTGGGTAGGWGTYRGVYTVPAGQTTTRFSFEATDGGSQGNLLDNIVFTPTIACPDSTSIISGRSAVNFNAVTNDYFPTNSTVSVVSVTGSGSATVSGTNLSLSSSSSGSYSVRYRITNPDNDTSESTVNVTVLSESTPRLPDVLLVDPRTSRVDFPQANFENTANLLVCVQESDAGGSILGSPTVSFDVASKGATDTTGFGSATVSGDRTSTLLIRHTQQNVLDTFNSLGGLRAYLSSGNFTSTKYVRVRTVPVATSTTAVTSATCGDAATSASKTIEIRPLELTNTLRKGTIQLK